MKKEQRENDLPKYIIKGQEFTEIRAKTVK